MKEKEIKNNGLVIVGICFNREIYEQEERLFTEHT